MRPLRIAIVTGLCVRHDAISNSVMIQREDLLAAGHDVTVFAHHSDLLEEPDAVTLADPWMLQGQPGYVGADVVIFHFGIGYQLFDALVVPHPGAVRVVHFHNVTPPELLTGRAHWAARSGLEQIAIAESAEAVWSDSPHNTEVLLKYTDVAPARVRPMSLCVPGSAADHVFDGEDDGVVGLPPWSGVTAISVGRLVAAKGVHDLVEAVGQLDPAATSRLRLIVTSSRRNSDEAYVEQLQARVTELGIEDSVVFLHDISDAALHRLYREADLFVSPSYHEGFCVPAIEAMSAGCRTIVTDAGALPDTVGACGEVVPAGDVRAMAQAIAEQVEQIVSADPVDEARRAEARRAKVAQFEPAAHRRRLLYEVERVMRNGRLGSAAEETGKFAAHQRALLERLACPQCRTPLAVADEVLAGGAVLDAGLVCPEHGRVGVIASFKPGFLDRDLERYVPVDTERPLAARLGVDRDVTVLGDWGHIREGVWTEGRTADSLTFEAGPAGFEVAFHAHDWSGIVRIEVEDGATWEVDLYRPTPEVVVVVGADELAPGTRVGVIATGTASSEAHGTQVIVERITTFVPAALVPTPGLTALNRGNPYPDRFAELIAPLAEDALVLDCGGGDRRYGDDRVFNLEYMDYELPDMYGDGLALPFLDESFDLVQSQAVLEHVPDPQRAVDEIIRILKPGGIAYFEVAFMQPLHAVPSHYMNVTPFGIEYLCRDLECLESGTFGGLEMTFEWFGRLIGASEKIGDERVAAVLATLRDLDEQMDEDELRHLASAVYLLGRKPTA